MAKMKALVKSKAEPGLWAEEVDVPEPGPNDVLVSIHKTSICGTDLHIYNWDEWSRKHVEVGTVIGHEFAGKVEEVGSSVKGFEKGDVVSGEGHRLRSLPQLPRGEAPPLQEHRRGRRQP